jgi:hypothetical protein
MIFPTCRTVSSDWLSIAGGVSPPICGVAMTFGRFRLIDLEGKSGVEWPQDPLGRDAYETLLRGTTPKGHLSSCGAGRCTLGISSDKTKGTASARARQGTGMTRSAW